MAEDKYRFQELLLKWFSIVLAIGGFVIGVQTYISQQESTRKEMEKEREARVEEYKRRTWERQFELFLQASKAASTLATIADPKNSEYAAARLRFEQLYHGELCMVESDEVATSMVDFRAAIRSAESNSTEAAGWNSLRRHSIALAKACRGSIEKSLSVDFGPARNKTE